ncbi:MAG: response regulator [Planctomycetales bacterium]|nr:response regulator [Planctomycetales bacterium]
MGATRILVVDDEPAVRDVLGKLFREAGYETETAADGAEGLRILRSRPPDLVITDIRMPEVSGIELTSEAKRLLPTLPVVLLSGEGDESVITAGFQAGADDYLAKPWRAGEVLAKVRRHLALAASALAATRPVNLPWSFGGGRFRLGARIGQGGMGTVFSALDTERGAEVAVKVLRAEMADDENFVRRFLSEARTLGRVSHPGVPRVHDVGREGSVHYCVMDLVSGDVLGDRLRRQPLPAAEVAAIGAGLCGVLEAIHTAGIVHRDVKPDNVILRPDGSPVLVDFGLARREQDPRLTGSGDVMGTIGYMAPEVILGRAPPDARTDLYGLGATLHAAATGQPPEREAGTFVAALLKAAAAPVLDPRKGNPAIPQALYDLIGRLAHPERERRPASAAEARAAFEELAGA